ncbi:MAG TPA: ATP-binding protein [Phycisphaerales bacterium]|nr:ATP-binding protein [Phycisphaerales bacterium]
MSPKPKSMRIQAKPTKEFFIEQLTRDISLIPAIVDLADNSVDGARRLKKDGDLDGLYINITAKSDKFEMSDNCGGIPLEIATNYAFRFGRANPSQPPSDEVGRFGIGMKRALFKLGNHFVVTSATATSRFKVDVRVSEWKAKADDWYFDFASPPEVDITVPKDQRGTTITVDELQESVAHTLGSTKGEEDLRDALASRLQYFIAKNLVVRLNDTTVIAHPHELVSTAKLAPAFKQLTLKGPSGGPVKVRLYCGIVKANVGDGKPEQAGWYVFCNGRLLLEADKSDATVWGKSGDKRFPLFHNQYTAFRGFAYFDAKDAGDLPMNTTKTGVDTESSVYRSARTEMLAMTRQVINFLNALKNERDAQREAGVNKKGPLTAMYEKSKMKATETIRTRDNFEIPKVKAPKWQSQVDTTVEVSYRVLAEHFEAVSDVLDIRKPSDVGLATFNDFRMRECPDE